MYRYKCICKRMPSGGLWSACVTKECAYQTEMQSKSGTKQLFQHLYKRNRTSSHAFVHRKRGRERETDRQTDRQTNRDREKDRDRDREKDREMERDRDRVKETTTRISII